MPSNPLSPLAPEILDRFLCEWRMTRWKNRDYYIHMNCAVCNKSKPRETTVPIPVTYEEVEEGVYVVTFPRAYGPIVHYCFECGYRFPQHEIEQKLKEAQMRFFNGLE